MSGRKQPKNGKPVSTPIAISWKKEITYPTPELQRMLKSIYNRYQKRDDSAANAEAREDFVFHMTDWIDDLNRLATIFAHPAEVEKKFAGDAVYGFLIHAVAHLNEAYRLLEGCEVRNPFLSTPDQA